MKLHQCLLFSAGFLFAAYAQAQVYKCTFTDATTKQSKVVYADSPCGKSNKQTLLDIQAKAQFKPQQAIQAQPAAQVGSLDLAVTDAVLKRDFKLAKSLATSKEHWRLIAIAEGEAQTPVLAQSKQDLAQASCENAKYDFDYVSRNKWIDKDLVAAKKSVMFASCGLPELEQNRPIFVGQSFGGLNSGRLFYGNSFAPYPIRRFNHFGNGFGQHGYPHAGRAQHDRAQFGGSANLTVRSKRFGLQINSNSFSNTGFSNTSVR